MHAAARSAKNSSDEGDPGAKQAAIVVQAEDSVAVLSDNNTSLQIQVYTPDGSTRLAFPLDEGAYRELCAQLPRPIRVHPHRWLPT